MRLFTYVVEHDYGFAPNPFHGVCTLATCKPPIRRDAKINDYVVGTGCAKKKRRGYLVYFMQVDETSDYDTYWKDPRFRVKRPLLRGSKMQAFGDNIYHRDGPRGEWLQENSFHSLPDGPNPINVRHDTKTTDRVLIGKRFAYRGGIGPQIPTRYRNYNGCDVCARRGYKCRFPPKPVEEFIDWLDSLDAQGLLGRPLDWIRTA